MRNVYLNARKGGDREGDEEILFSGGPARQINIKRKLNTPRAGQCGFGRGECCADRKLRPGHHGQPAPDPFGRAPHVFIPRIFIRTV